MSLASATPSIEYRQVQAAVPLPHDVLSAVAFGVDRLAHADPRYVHVSLKPLRGKGVMELWRVDGPTQIGREGPIRFCADATHLAGVIELNECEYGGIAGATRAAYAALRRFLSESSHPYALRIWNYFDGINRGQGDDERYKQFCIGRAAGFGAESGIRDAAATAIGRRDGDPTLQVYWLAGRAPGIPIENPRQTAPHRYPREYGPIAPSFSRAMLVSQNLVMVSGTASIVGHASKHPDDLAAQLDEVLANLAAVLQRASALAPQLQPKLGANSLLKFYLRDAGAVERAEMLLREKLPADTSYIILEADICRSDLLVESDCVHGVTMTRSES